MTDQEKLSLFIGGSLDGQRLHVPEHTFAFRSTPDEIYSRRALKGEKVVFMFFALREMSPDSVIHLLLEGYREDILVEALMTVAAPMLEKLIEKACVVCGSTGDTLPCLSCNRLICGDCGVDTRWCKECKTNYVPRESAENS